MSEEKARSYICENIKNGKICGESNYENFTKGRYTTCNQCKKEYLREYRIKVKKVKEFEKNTSIIERIDNNMGSLGENIHTMVNDVINETPLKGIGISLPGKLQEFEDNMMINNTKINIILLAMEKKIDSLVKENENLKEIEKDLKKDNGNLKRDFEQLFDKYSALITKYEL
jgi:hypothetical protein